MTALRFSALAATVIALATLVMTGCEADSPNSLERNVGVDYTGFYRGNFEGNRIPNKNTGTPVTFMNLRQTGARLEAIDNTGYVWNGDIGNNPDAENLQATFTLEGETTAGADVVINGTLTKDEAGSTTATMTGSWIEPTFVAILSAAGSVSATSTNSGGGGGTITLSASPTTISASATSTITASGASGTITWTASPTGLGTLTPSSTTATYTRSPSGGSSGQQITITAQASNGSGTTIITFQ